MNEIGIRYWFQYRVKDDVRLLKIIVLFLMKNYAIKR